MADTDAFALGRSDFNGFLFAELGVDSTGSPVSVLSALARLDLDPWQEAARLSKLPRRMAIEVLAKVIATMPASLWPLPDATIIATRLVDLLPARGAGMLAGPSATRAPERRRTALQWAVLLALISALLAALLFTFISHGGLSTFGVASAGSPSGMTSIPATRPAPSLRLGA